MLWRDASQRSQILRDVWQGTKAFHLPDQLVFLDEAAANEKTGWRKFGWCPRGHKAVTKGSLGRSERYSILPAFNINGYKPGTKIIQGSITQEIFNEWIRDEVLARCNRFPGPDSVLILNNCVVHKHVDVLSMCEGKGVYDLISTAIFTRSQPDGIDVQSIESLDQIERTTQRYVWRLRRLPKLCHWGVSMWLVQWRDVLKMRLWVHFIELLAKLII